MIELKGLSCGYNGHALVRDISLAFPEAKITTIVGPNGCGKSTLLLTAAGLLPPVGGAALLDGASIPSMSRKELAKKIAFLPQSRNVHPIAAKTMVMHGRFPYLGYPRRYRREDMDMARQSMERVGIHHLADRSMAELSGGERQKVLLAMALAQDTDIIFLDEPTTYLDISHQLDIMGLAEELRDTGKTVILVLHDLNLALRHSDFLAVMDRGKVLRFGPPGDVYASGVLEQAFGVKVFRQETASMGDQYFFG